MVVAMAVLLIPGSERIMRRVAFRTAVARFVHSVPRRRRLLVLGGKIVFAEGAAKLPEHFGRLALGVQGLARLAAEGLPSEHGHN
jgi:hypothetical protein